MTIQLCLQSCSVEVVECMFHIHAGKPLPHAIAGRTSVPHRDSFIILTPRPRRYAPDTEEWPTMNISMKEEGQVGMAGLVVDPSDLIDCPTQVDWNKPFH